MQTEIELFRAITENLYTAVLGDVLDVLGHTHQFLPQPVQPMKESMRLVGRAMPVQIADTWSQQKDPFGLMTEALDQLLPARLRCDGGLATTAPPGAKSLPQPRAFVAPSAQSLMDTIATPCAYWSRTGRYSAVAAMRRTQASVRRSWPIDARSKLGEYTSNPET